MRDDAVKLDTIRTNLLKCHMDYLLKLELQKQEIERQITDAQTKHLFIQDDLGTMEASLRALVDNQTDEVAHTMAFKRASIYTNTPSSSSIANVDSKNNSTPTFLLNTPEASARNQRSGSKCFLQSARSTVDFASKSAFSGLKTSNAFVPTRTHLGFSNMELGTIATPIPEEDNNAQEEEPRNVKRKML